jgi:predicted enzyme related to lactoylglutathione lyase
MTDSSIRGRFVWYDLMTHDPKSAQAFYTRVMNWGTQPMEGMPYTMWTAGGRTIGGVMENPQGPGVPSHWLAYIGVPDVDATVTQAASLGARTHVPPSDIPGIGRFSALSDPQGAAFAIFSPKDGTPQPETDPAIGDFSWHELATSDYASGFAFYQALFGWDKTAEHDMGEMGIYLLYGRNGRELGGMFTIGAAMPMPPHWLQYIRVESADAAVERVKANGGTVMNGPMEVPGGDRVAQCMDPQGGAFAVHSKKA